MTTHACSLPYWHQPNPYRCDTCGQWWAVVTFHDYELGTSWPGWDRMPDPGVVA